MCHGQEGRTGCSEGSLDFCLDNGVHFKDLKKIWPVFTRRAQGDAITVGGTVPAVRPAAKEAPGTPSAEKVRVPSKRVLVLFEDRRYDRLVSEVSLQLFPANPAPREGRDEAEHSNATPGRDE